MQTEEITKELKKLDKKTEVVELYAQGLQISNEKDYEEALKEAKNLKTLLEQIQASEDKLVLPAKEIIKNAQALHKPIKKRLEGSVDSIKEKMKVFFLAEQQKKQIAKDKIAARADKGTMRIDTAMQKLDQIGEQEKSVSTGEAKVTMAKSYIYEVVDIQKISYEFLTVNMVKVKAWEKENGALPEGIKKTEDVSVRLY